MSYLRELDEQIPFAERWPPHAFPADFEPWSSGAAEFFASEIAFYRDIADCGRAIRDNPITSKGLEKITALLLHSKARITARLQSWSPMEMH